MDTVVDFYNKKIILFVKTKKTKKMKTFVNFILKLLSGIGYVLYPFLDYLVLLLFASIIYFIYTLGSYLLTQDIVELKNIWEPVLIIVFGIILFVCSLQLCIKNNGWLI